MSAPLHIVEPTLADESGHCHSFVASLLSCEPRPALVIWADKKVNLPQFGSLPNLEMRPYFSRRLRRLQAYLLYRRLLKQAGKIFVTTAGRGDLQLIDWAVGKYSLPARKVFLYVHWLNLNPSKLKALRRIALRRPQLVLLAPTQSVVDLLHQAGFTGAQLVPYPVSGAKLSVEPAPFRHVLYAGAARQDKGFSSVVDLVSQLADMQGSLPVVLQTSSEHYGKLDEQTRADIARLAQINYPLLHTHTQTLSGDEYAKLYQGAICLQPYDTKDFADRISGVTLDAMRNGAPAIVPEGTWMAGVVNRFEAGIVLEDFSAKKLLIAVEKIRADYNRYQQNAFNAGATLAQENSAQHLLSAIS